MRWRRFTVVVLVLATSATYYAAYRSLEHFLWHVGYGASAGMLLAAAVAGARGRPVRHPVAWALGAYAYMVVPDVLFLLGHWVAGTPYPHQPWMDVFLGHHSLDRWTPATTLVLPTYLASWALLGVAQGWRPWRQPRPSDT